MGVWRVRSVYDQGDRDRETALTYGCLSATGPYGAT